MPLLDSEFLFHPFHFPFLIAFGDGFPFIVLAFTDSHTDLQLRFSSFKV
jgi:hypothetical protein